MSTFTRFFVACLLAAASMVAVSAESEDVWPREFGLASSVFLPVRGQLISVEAVYKGSEHNSPEVSKLEWAIVAAGWRLESPKDMVMTSGRCTVRLLRKKNNFRGNCWLVEGRETLDFTAKSVTEVIQFITGFPKHRPSPSKRFRGRVLPVQA